MSDTNIVILTGRLTRSPSIRSTTSGGFVGDIDIACNRYSTKREQFTTYVRTTVWNKQAEWAGETLKVGDTIMIQGQLFDNNFEKDGQKTSGRLKVDNARVKLLQKSNKQQEESTQLEMPEI